MGLLCCGYFEKSINLEACGLAAIKIEFILRRIYTKELLFFFSCFVELFKKKIKHSFQMLKNIPRSFKYCMTKNLKIHFKYTPFVKVFKHNNQLTVLVTNNIFSRQFYLAKVSGELTSLNKFKQKTIIVSYLLV